MIKGIKGVKDLLPEETPRWRLIEEAARRWAGRYGFHEIRIPIFEVTTLFARSIGASTDIVEKEMGAISECKNYVCVLAGQLNKRRVEFV